MWHAGSLSRTMWDLAPWPGIEPGSAILGVESLSHWTSRKVPEGIQFNPWHRVLHKTQRNITRLHGRKPAGTKTVCPCLAKVAALSFRCLRLCVLFCMWLCVCVPTPSLSPSLSVSLSLHIVWFSLLRVPSGQACLYRHPFSIPSRFKHPPVMSSETLNSKFLGDSPQDLALIPYWPLVDTTGHGQSQKNHNLCGVLNRPGLWEGQVSWRKGKGVKKKQ